MKPVEVRVRRLDHARDLPLPSYATPGSAGADLVAACDDEMLLGPRQRALVPTGLVLEIPAGWEGQIRARSGRAWKEGLALVNAPGTLDSDYRGEVRVLLINLGSEPVRVRRGERIAQLVVAPVARATWQEVEESSETGRGAGGFGSSGS